MRNTNYLILAVITILFWKNVYLAQSKYIEMKNRGYSSQQLMQSGIYPDSSDFISNNEEKKIKNQPKTLEELADENILKGVENQLKLHNPKGQLETYAFDSKSTNYERFKNSPCFDKIGFSPLSLKTPENVKALEEIYEACEHRNTVSKFWKGTFFGAFVLVLLATIYFGIGKDKIKNIFSKKSSTVINEME